MVATGIEPLRWWGRVWVGGQLTVLIYHLGPKLSLRNGILRKFLVFFLLNYFFPAQFWFYFILMQHFQESPRNEKKMFVSKKIVFFIFFVQRRGKKTFSMSGADEKTGPGWPMVGSDKSQQCHCRPNSTKIQPTVKSTLARGPRHLTGGKVASFGKSLSKTK